MSKASKIKILLDGDSHTFEMNTDETILDVAIDNDIDMPYSCKSFNHLIKPSSLSIIS